MRGMKTSFGQKIAVPCWGCGEQIDVWVIGWNSEIPNNATDGTFVYQMTRQTLEYETPHVCSRLLSGEFERRTLV